MAKRIKQDDKGNLIVYKKLTKKTKSLFKNKPSEGEQTIISKIILVNIGHNTFKAIPYNTYKKLNTISTFYTNNKLYSYDEIDDDMVLEHTWKLILHTPEEIVKFYNDLRYTRNVYYNQIPSIWWDTLFDLKYKKIKFKTKDGKKHKMSFDNFAYKYLKGIQL